MSLATDLKIIKDAELDIELLDRENEKMCAENNVKVEGLRDVIKSTELILEEELKASGEKKLECKIGYCSYRVMPDKWIYTEKDLMPWIMCLPEKLKEQYLKITTKVKVGDLKKQIIYYNNVLFEDGKLIKENLCTDITGDELFLQKNCRVQGISIERQEPQFNYKIK